MIRIDTNIWTLVLVLLVSFVLIRMLVSLFLYKKAPGSHGTGIAIKGSVPDFPKTHSLCHKHESNNMLDLLTFVTTSKKLRGHGILTVCPSAAPFGIALGPTNPWLIDIAKETLGFRRARISLALRLLVPTFSLPNAPARLTP